MYNGCKVKVDIPYFDAHLHVEDYLDWEQSMEAFFKYMDIPTEKQIRYVACKLKGAGAWWQQLMHAHRREGRPPITSWSRMKQVLRGHFLPSDYEQILYVQYQRCSQGNRSVSEYTEEFYPLNARNNLQETHHQLVARYIGGLKEVIQDKLEMNTIWSLSQAIKLCIQG